MPLNCAEVDPEASNNDVNVAETAECFLVDAGLSVRSSATRIACRSVSPSVDTLGRSVEAARGHPTWVQVKLLSACSGRPSIIAIRTTIDTMHPHFD